MLTFEVEEHIGSVVFEHLGNQLNVHILDIDFLPGTVPALVEGLSSSATARLYTWRFLFKTMTASLSFS